MIWRISQFLEVLPPKAKHLLDLRNSAYQPRSDHHVQSLLIIAGHSLYEPE